MATHCLTVTAVKISDSKNSLNDKKLPLNYNTQKNSSAAAAAAAYYHHNIIMNVIVQYCVLEKILTVPFNYAVKLTVTAWSKLHSSANNTDISIRSTAHQCVILWTLSITAFVGKQMQTDNVISRSCSEVWPNHLLFVPKKLSSIHR